MQAGRRALATFLALAVAPGCATTNTGLSVPVMGRAVTVVTDPKHEEVKGELLMVEKDRLFVRAKDGVREIPLADVREARVRRHDFGAAKAFTWAVLGGLVTGGALAAACSSVEDAGNCGGIGLVTFGLWLGIGALCAPSLESSSRLMLERPTPDELRAFARLPQGLPAGVTLATLAPASDKK